MPKKWFDKNNKSLDEVKELFQQGVDALNGVRESLREAPFSARPWQVVGKAPLPDHVREVEVTVLRDKDNTRYKQRGRLNLKMRWEYPYLGNWYNIDDYGERAKVLAWREIDNEPWRGELPDAPAT